MENNDDVQYPERQEARITEIQKIVHNSEKKTQQQKKLMFNECFYI